MKSKVMSCILCATLIFTSLPTSITVQASENDVTTTAEQESEIESAESETIGGG